MDKAIKNKTNAMIILHEIYGINEFIKEQCQKYRQKGFDVYCPNMIDCNPFSYAESEEAYHYFIENVGFNYYTKINTLVRTLKEKHDKVLILGFSVGATIAWRCCENVLCDGIIACYGSRIRDYMDLNPAYPTLLLFAEKDSFDVLTLVNQIEKKMNLTINTFDATHGFMDSHSKNYNECQSKKTESLIAQFISKCIKKYN